MTVHLSTTSFNFRRRLYYLFFFLIGLLFIDNGGGWVLSKMYKHINTGPGRYNYIRSKSFDILIMGSSTSTAYYAERLSKKTGLSTLNVGLDGSALIYSRCLLDLVIKKNVKPKIVILNIDLFELSKNAWSGNYYSMIDKLRPLYGETPLISTSLEKEHFTESLKYFSRLYRYNDLLLSIPFQLFSGSDIYHRGLSPNAIMSLPLSEETIKERYPVNIDFDPRKYNLYKDFILACKSNQIIPVFIESPIYYPGFHLTKRDKFFENKIEGLAEYYRIPFIKINQETDAIFRTNTLFKDVLHLNHEGSMLFTDIVVSYIQNIYHIPSP